MKDDSLTEQLIRLAYADLIMEHAQKDSLEEFIENFQEDSSKGVSNRDLDNPIDRPSRASIWQRLSNNINRHRRLSVFSGLLLIVIAPILLLLVWSNLAYKHKILPGTSYGSIELDSNPSKALDQIKALSSGYKYTLKFNNSQNTYPAHDIGITINPESTIQEAQAQSDQVRFFSKPFALFSSRRVDSSVSIDQSKLKSFLEAQNYADKLPEDAKIEYNTDQLKFVAVPEVAGRGIDSKSLSSKLEESAKALSTSVIDLKIENVDPDIKQANLEDPLDQANSFVSQKITLTSANKNYSPSVEVMKDWVVLTPDPQSGTYSVTTDSAEYKEYVDGIVKKVNRKMEKKLYATIDGSEMLLQEGLAGLQVSNADAARNQLASVFNSKKGGTIALETKEESPTIENVAASGGRWIFADISQFRVFAYEGSHLANSFAMSSGKSSTPTPTGRYQVMSKVRVKTMTSGGNKNSKDYYSVPNIEWVAYFKSGGYAMHGVYWHNKFGVENTSHGCMGMSNASAQWVYNFIDIGTPVIVVP